MEITLDRSTMVAEGSPEFVIGVTGHRDILEADRDRLRDQLRAVLANVEGHFNNAPVRLLSGMAEGADILAAEVALEMNIGVLAVLPMPRQDYAEDFEGAALERFQSLLEHPGVTVMEMPMAEAAGRTETPARDLQYQMLADYIVRRSNALIAIWDMVDVGLTGGTSDVVMRYLADGGNLSPIPISAEGSGEEDCGNILFLLPAHRQSAPDFELSTERTCRVSNSNYDCYWQQDGIPDQFLTRWQGFDAYAGEWLSDLGADLPSYNLSEEGDALNSDFLAKLDNEYVRVDQLAGAYQTNSDRMFALFGLLAAAMGLVFLIYAKLLADKTFLFIYVGLFVFGFLGFRYSARRHLHSKHLAYRALAETFRVQFFLVLSGAGAEYRLRRMLSLTSVDRFTRFEWLQEAVRCAEPVMYSGHCEKSNALSLVRNRWINDQAGYFDKKLHRLHAQHHRLEIIKTTLLTGSVIGALMLIYFKGVLVDLEMMGYNGKAWLVFFMGLLPLWVAVWELYQGKMATREMLWQYSNQRRYFREAEREIKQVPGLAEGQKIIRDLADKALIEIYLWSVHRYHREHEPPAAG